MPESLAYLEQQRSAISQQTLQLPNFCGGTITKRAATKSMKESGGGRCPGAGAFSDCDLAS